MAQLRSVLFAAPAPETPALFPCSVQLIKVPEFAPPPCRLAELLINTQFEINAFVDWHHAPPPSSSTCAIGFCPVAPFVRVNPIRLAPSTSDTQRIALGLFRLPGIWYPSMVVTPGPLTLSTAIGSVIATRLVSCPMAARPPV